MAGGADLALLYERQEGVRAKIDVIVGSEEDLLACAWASDLDGKDSWKVLPGEPEVGIEENIADLVAEVAMRTKGVNPGSLIRIRLVRPVDGD